MGGFSNFAISFTIISVLSGCLNSYYIAFNNGGPVAITWGWLLVGGFCILVALAMGEIASAMPTAGALYFWASRARRARPGAGSPAGSTSSARSRSPRPSTTAPRSSPPRCSTSGSRPLGTDTDRLRRLHRHRGPAPGVQPAQHQLPRQLYSLSVWWHMIGVALIVVVLLVVPTRHQSVGFVFTQTINNSGFGERWSQPLLVRLRPRPADGAVHHHRLRRLRAHERGDTQAASRAAAWGMVMSVASRWCSASSCSWP